MTKDEISWERFAAAALTGILSHPDCYANGPKTNWDIAEDASNLADVMLKEEKIRFVPGYKDIG